MSAKDLLGIAVAVTTLFPIAIAAGDGLKNSESSTDKGSYATSQSTSTSIRNCNSATPDFEPPKGSWYWQWENDSLAVGSGSDEFYTQGMQFGYTYSAARTPSWLATPADWLCKKLSGESGRTTPGLIGNVSLFLGQHLFTPGDIKLSDPPLDDRPYAAWLYVGTKLSLAQPRSLAANGNRRWRTLSFELQAGTTGPRANGEWAQRDFHKLIRYDVLPQGWDHQIPGAAGVQTITDVSTRLSSWNVRMPGYPQNADLIANGELALGTLQTHFEAEGIFRLGRNLSADLRQKLGPTLELANVRPPTANDENEPRRQFANRIAQATDTTPCLEGRGLFDIRECYLFVGVGGRVVAHNAFLDGTFLHDSPHVDKEPAYYTLSWGARVRWKRFRFDYSFVRRSREFSPIPQSADFQDGRHDYGVASLSCSNTDDDRTDALSLTCPAFIGLVILGIFAQ